MTTLKIDNTEYDLDSLSNEAKAQLASLQFVDQELARLQAQMAVLQTARSAYLNGLKSLLPSPNTHKRTPTLFLRNAHSVRYNHFIPLSAFGDCHAHHQHVLQQKTKGHPLCST